MSLTLSILGVAVSWAGRNKSPQTGWVKPQKLILSQLWRPQVQVKVWAGLVPSEDGEKV